VHLQDPDFVNLSLTRALLHRRPRGGIDLCPGRVIEGFVRKMVMYFIKAYVLFFSSKTILTRSGSDSMSDNMWP
jgi:hypothetical protein